MTVNLDQAKRLWELGARREAEKYWVDFGIPVKAEDKQFYAISGYDVNKRT